MSHATVTAGLLLTVLTDEELVPATETQQVAAFRGVGEGMRGLVGEERVLGLVREGEEEGVRVGQGGGGRGRGGDGLRQVTTGDEVVL